MSKPDKHTLDIQPLALADFFGVPRTEVYARLGVSEVRARQLVRNPKHRRRVWVAALEACLEEARLQLSLQSLVKAGV